MKNSSCSACVNCVSNKKCVFICYVWKHSTSEFVHIRKNRDSACEASRTLATASVKKVERPKSAKSAPAEERTCIEGIKSDGSGVEGDYSISQPRGTYEGRLDDTMTPERDRTTTESSATKLRGSNDHDDSSAPRTNIHTRLGQLSLAHLSINKYRQLNYTSCLLTTYFT